MQGLDSFRTVGFARNVMSNIDMLRSISAPDVDAEVGSTSHNLVFGLRAEVGPTAEVGVDSEVAEVSAPRPDRCAKRW